MIIFSLSTYVRTYVRRDNVWADGLGSLNCEEVTLQANGLTAHRHHNCNIKQFFLKLSIDGP